MLIPLLSITMCSRFQGSYSPEGGRQSQSADVARACFEALAMLLSIRAYNLEVNSAHSGSSCDGGPGVASDWKPFYGICNHSSTEGKIISATA
jgi:hypothetical protein